MADEFTDGRRWLLVINEAHRGRSAVWDEVQAIANQLGTAAGVCRAFRRGRQPICRDRSSGARSSIGLAAQISSHIHLKPIDLDEARELLEAAGTIGRRTNALLEELHRKSHGNPAMLLRLAQSCRLERGEAIQGQTQFRREGRTVRSIEHRRPWLPRLFDATSTPRRSRICPTKS